MILNCAEIQNWFCVSREINNDERDSGQGTRFYKRLAAFELDQSFSHQS
jgi:hypothetical protein